MFKKLKEKITEEVKSSPQRLQQFTQSVSDKLQSTGDEIFFSIGDDDVSNTSESIEPGFSNVSLTSEKRRNSNSSLASDVSFLPRYESTSLYHLQSDLDISASEIEDNSSTNSQLGHLSKEQIYTAFQKSQMRYHKYRGRYTDLAKHYKELERNNSKLNSVLVETQDKAIRRVTELKEQCALEQKAKAHLESALRDELDEKQYKIHSLETKIELLQKNDRTNLQTNADTENPNENDRKKMDILCNEVNEARKEIEALNQKLQEAKASGIVLQSRDQENKIKISHLEKEIKRFDEVEKQNNLKMAQIKMELHNELLNKDAEIFTLKKHTETLQEQNDTLKSQLNSNTRVENLQNQNKNLIEKLESITQRNNNLESDLLKLHSYKVDNNELNKLNLELSENNKKYKEEIENMTKQYLHSLKKHSNIVSKLNSLKESVRKIKQENDIFGSHFKEENVLFNNEFQQVQKIVKESLFEIENLRKQEQESFIQAFIKVQKSEKPSLADKSTETRENCISLMEHDLIMNKTISEHEGNIQKLQSDIENKQKNIEDLILQLKTMENDKNELVKLLDNTRESLELKLNKSTEQNEIYENELSRVKRAFSDLENEELKLVSKCEKLQETVDRLQTQLETFEKEKEVMRTEFELVLSKKDTEIGERMEEVASICAESSLKEKKMLEDINQLKNDNKQLKSQIDSQIEEIGKLQMEVSNGVEENHRLVQKNVILGVEIENLKQENKNLLENSDKCNKDLVDFEQQKEDIDKKWSEKLKALEELKKQYVSENLSLKQKLETHESVIESLHSRSTEDAENLVKQSTEIEVLKTTISELQSNYEAVCLEKTELNTKLVALQNIENKLEILENEKFAILRDLENMKSKCDLMDELQTEISNLKHELDKTNEKYEISKKFVSENEYLKSTHSLLESEIVELKSRLNQLVNDNENVLHENQTLLNELETIKFELEESRSENSAHSIINNEIVQQELLELRKTCEELSEENEALSKSNNELELKCKNITECNENLVKTSTFLTKEENQTSNNDSINSNCETAQITSTYLEELTALRQKLDEYKILNNSNKTSAEFYENELQKLKLKNEKLNRKLDETLFALNHCAELSDSTENEYLKNIVYNYMLGKESLVLARVIAAVCKFDTKQTEAVLQKEQQKQSMLGQLGIL